MTEQRTPEWYEARKNRVTASMAGAILGLSPHMTRDDAMRAMVRDALGAEREQGDNIALEYGRHNEEAVLLDFRMETGLDVQPCGFFPYEDWLGASPDGLVSDGGNLEIKCPFSRRQRFGDKAGTEPPLKSLDEQPHYYAQMQVAMCCTPAPHCWFVQWSAKETQIQKVKRDLLWLQTNLPRLKQFHAEFLDALKDPAEYLAPKRVEIDTPEAHRMVAEWDELKEQAERIKERQADLLVDMTKLAKERNALFAGRKLTLVEKQGSVSYAKALKELAPNFDLSPYRGKSSSFWRLG